MMIQLPPGKLGVMPICQRKLGVTVNMDTSKSHGGYIHLHITVIYVKLFVNCTTTLLTFRGGAAYVYHFRHRTTTLLTFHGGAAYVYLSDIHFQHLSIWLGPLCSRRALVLLPLMIIITSSMAVGPMPLSLGPTPHLSMIGLDFSVLHIYYPYPAIYHCCANLLATFALQLVGVGGLITSRPPDRSPSYWIAEQILTYLAILRYYKTYGANPVWARIYQEYLKKVTNITTWEI